MNAKYIFNLKSEEKKRELPGKIIIGQQDTETIVHVVLKLMGYLIFYRDRIQIETAVPNDRIPFTPDLVQLDYELQPRLWVECGECGANKLHKLAVKAPDAEIWIVKRSQNDVRHLIDQLARVEARPNRYQILCLDGDMFREICNMVEARNEIVWYRGDFDPPLLQFEFNGLWFESTFTVTKY